MQSLAAVLSLRANRNEVAARIWQLLDGKTQLSQVKDRITEEFEVSPSQAEKDIRELIGKLESLGVVI